jgi:hypothetical protein
MYERIRHNINKEKDSKRIEEIKQLKVNKEKERKRIYNRRVKDMK